MIGATDNTIFFKTQQDYALSSVSVGILITAICNDLVRQYGHWSQNELNCARLSRSAKLGTHVALRLLIEISYGPNLEIAYVVGRGWLPLPKKNPTPSPALGPLGSILGPSGASIQPPIPASTP